MLLITTILLLGAGDTGEGLVANGSLTIGTGIVSAILGWFASKKHAEKTAVPQPCTIEQSSYQAAMKANEHDHENLFNRVARIERDLAGVTAKLDANIESIKEQLGETKEMVRQLFENNCKGGRKS